jgi:acetyl/propionyl-CoA carboxylase alpha subunit
MTTRSIQKILIANRGEIARRVMRTCREMGIATVAVCSDADRDAPFVHEADEVVRLGGLLASESYLRGEAILEAARKTGSDAIHPGYGFLSENAAFARMCQEVGIVFIGPPADAIAAMGSKIEAKKLMKAADVPILPSVDVGSQSASQVLKQVEPLGWPLLIKASAGGGGRGMRIVRHAEEFASHLATAQRESQSAFGDGTLFVEPYSEAARHIEIQIFGDIHGNVVHLFERECSIQRRHQKIIEESPSVALDDNLRGAMTAAAVRAAQAIGYVNAGTVEFLLTPGKDFYFLEVNTRLQVEHPVTECITGLDLVRLQILIAQGQPLPPEVYSVTMQGHAIEARLCAEDPRQDYLPSAGRLHRFRISPVAGLRVDSAIEEAAVISPYYDSMLAKVIVHAPTRREAALRLRTSLAQAQLHGLKTNRELLVRTLEHPEFLEGKIDTHFLQRHDAAALSAPLGDTKVEHVHAIAAALAAQADRRQQATILAQAPSGWRNNPSQFQQIRFQGSEAEIVIDYCFSRDGLRIRAGTDEYDQVSYEAIPPDRIRLGLNGIERSFSIHRIDGTSYVDSSLGSSTLVEIPRFPRPKDEAIPGSLIAPLPGVVNEVRVKKGDTVAAGDVVLVIDSMKVFHWISAPLAGRVVEIRVECGNHVEAGTVVAVIEDT